jgi:twitching motility protein PilT
MAQLDKLLSRVAPRGASGIVLEPDAIPVFVRPDGGRFELTGAPRISATIISGLALDIAPASLKEDWRVGRDVEFDHELDGRAFRVRCRQDAATGDARIEVELLAVGASRRESLTERDSRTVAIPPPPGMGRDDLSGNAARKDREGQTGRGIPIAIELPGDGLSGLVKRQGEHPMASKLFRALLDKKGSDLHCSSFEVPIVRVNGEMLDLDGFGIIGAKEMVEIMESIASEAAWSSFRTRNDADFAYPFEEANCRLRVNYFLDRVGPGFVARVIPDAIPDPVSLGLPEPVCRLAGIQKGLVLVTGPTGSGKSTTLAAIIDIANRTRNDHILTIEDPIEFVHPRKKCLVNQREVGTHTDSFKSGLRAALREDPDIVMVGEMRDLETIAIALETAITGHLVFGTLHTNSAIGTIDRIVDQFPADRQQQIRVMLSESLRAVVSQTLVKRIGGGRVAALETLFVNPAIANLIREGKNYQITSAMQTGRSYGQRLMNDALVDLIQSKCVEAMDAYTKCPDRESFIAACKRAGIEFDLRIKE